MNIGPRDELILEALERFQPCPSGALARAVELSPREVRARLNRLYAIGLAEPDRPSWRLWWRLAPSRAHTSRGRANGTDVSGDTDRFGLTRASEDEADRVKRSARPRKLRG